MLVLMSHEHPTKSLVSKTPWQLVDALVTRLQSFYLGILTQLSCRSLSSSSYVPQSSLFGTVRPALNHCPFVETSLFSEWARSSTVYHRAADI